MSRAPLNRTECEPRFKAPRAPKAAAKPMRQKSAKKTETDKELERIRPLVLARSKGVCEVKAEGCEGRAVHMHHRRMRSQGGRHTLSNLIHTCAYCHFVCHHAEDRYERGWLIRSHDRAAS